MDRSELVKACETLPLFPLAGTVLLPASLLPLHVFEPRYRQLVQDCLGSGGPLCVPEVAEGGAVDMRGAPPILPYASVGFITAHQSRPDGRYNIVLEPRARIRIVEELADSGHPYRVARAEVLEDESVSEWDMQRIGERIRGLFAAHLATRGPEAQGLAKALGGLQASRIPDALAGFVFEDASERQQFLAENNPLARARLVEGAAMMHLAESRSDVAEA
jgi:Lon protease-like protein